MAGERVFRREQENDSHLIIDNTRVVCEKPVQHVHLLVNGQRKLVWLTIKRGLSRLAHHCVHPADTVAQSLQIGDRRLVRGAVILSDKKRLTVC